MRRGLNDWKAGWPPSLERFLADEERIEKPRAGWKMKLEFRKPEHVSRYVLVLQDLNVGYEPDRPSIRNLSLEIRSLCRIVLAGANGSGKTT